VLLLIVTNQDDVASTATKPGPGVGDGSAFVIELAFTTIFVLVILQASRSERFGSSALVAIPLTLLAVHTAAIPFSGSSVNPARTFGPDLVGNTWTGIWIYFIAPPLGAALAWAIHAGVIRGAEGPAPEAVAEALREPVS
jgi:glycerol uptake facilitator-like aquaporin